MEETVELLRLLGFRNPDVIEANGISGADLLELDEHEMRDELKVPHLQVCTPYHPACPNFAACSREYVVSGVMRQDNLRSGTGPSHAPIASSRGTFRLDTGSVAKVNFS